MSHTVLISLEFSFKGETFRPQLHLDPDRWMSNGGNPDELHHMLAESIGFGPYSHEYDVLMMSEIEFSEAKGLISAFIDQGELNYPDFHRAWQEQKVRNRVLPIAERYLSNELINNNPGIEQALIECYYAGQNNPESRITDEGLHL